MYENTQSITLPVLSASADILRKLFVTYKATVGLSLPDTVGDSTSIIGITAEDYVDATADTGESQDVLPVYRLDGSGKLEITAGDAITVGQKVIAGNDGKAMPSSTTATATTPAGDYQEVGIAFTAAGAADEILTILPIRGEVITTA